MRYEIFLKYAELLEDLDNISKYNWCEHVLTYTCQGLAKKDSKYPKVDVHFLLVSKWQRTFINKLNKLV